MKRVLIVDDDEVLLDVLGKGLERYKEKFEAVFAQNGLEALGILEKEKVDLVVTDMQMPMMDGLVLLAYMRENLPETPCILMTAYGTPELRKELKGEVLYFIDKPIRVNSLASAIIKALSDKKNNKPKARIAIADILQLIRLGKKTCIFKLKADNGTSGYFYFHEGELYNAVWGKLRGDEAVYAMLDCDSAELTFTKAPETKGVKKVTKSLDELIDIARKKHITVTSDQVRRK